MEIDRDKFVNLLLQLQREQRGIEDRWILGETTQKLRNSLRKQEQSASFKSLAEALIPPQLLSRTYTVNLARLSERFYADWTRAEAATFDRLGFSWRTVVGLLAFRSRAKALEQKNRVQDANRIEQALRTAVRDVRNGELVPADALRTLKAWQLKHPKYFGESIGHTKGGLARRVSTAASTLFICIDAAVGLGEIDQQEAGAYRQHVRAIEALGQQLRRGE